MARRKSASDGNVVVDLSKPPPAPKPDPDKPPDYGTKTPEPPKVASPPLQPAVPDSDGNDLASQLQASKRREQAARTRADQERSARVAAEQERMRALSERQQERGHTEQAQYDSVVNALAARKSEVETLRVSYRDALARGDTNSADEINERLLTARMDVRDLENGKGEFDREFERRRAQPQPQPQYQQSQQAPTVEQMLSQMPGLLHEEREWLREHPSALTDPYEQKQLEAAYYYCQKHGLERGSDEYFDAIEQRLGYDAEERGERGDRLAPVYDDEERMNEPAPPPRRQSYAAPPSRSAPGSGTRHVSDERVELTPEQRQAAKISGVTEYEYAKGVKRLRELKARGYYQEVG
jgi:hypothetical protein